MRDNFAACLRETLAHEGGWADHPRDPGGATMKGITIGTYRDWKGRPVTKAELRAITDAEVAAIYRRWYWEPVRGDDLPAGLDLVAFDGAVNSGPSRGAKWLQSALRVTADGKIGPATIAAARAADPAAAVNRACDARMAFLRGLSTWGTFGKGWTRRVDSVRATALRMASGAAPPSKPSQPIMPPRAEPPADPVAASAPIAIVILVALVAAYFILGG